MTTSTSSSSSCLYPQYVVYDHDGGQRDSGVLQYRQNCVVEGSLFATQRSERLDRRQSRQLMGELDAVV